MECHYISKVVLPNTITSIGEIAFSSCGNLTEINIPDSITNIGNGAFYNCNDLTIYYSNDALNEYISSNQDDWSYNNITWIKQ